VKGGCGVEWRPGLVREMARVGEKERLKEGD